jgi:excisionase family DNA binding protein
MTASQDPIIIAKQSQLAALIEHATTKALEGVLKKREEDVAAGGSKAWLTNDEAAGYLGLSKVTLARYRSEGKLPYSRVGGAVYYRLTDVEALLESGLGRREA